jgi:hypothetical protein
VKVALLLLRLLSPTQEIELPTPLEHYQSYDWEADARALALELAASAPEDARGRAAALLESSTPEEVRALLESLDWRRYRGRLESVLLHGSRVLEVVPEEASRWRPLIHDSLLLFLDGQVFREIGPRLLRTVWFPSWNSHEYRTLLSNEDVKDVQVKRTGQFFKKVGKGIWAGISFQWLF